MTMSQTSPETFEQGLAARITHVRVVDGDSIECLSRGHSLRVRLYGLDAPELSQRLGPEAAENLTSIVGRTEPLMIEVMDHDQYGRVVGLLYPANAGRNGTRSSSINLRQVREGYAYAYTRRGDEEIGIRAAEEEARRTRRGVWKAGEGGGERPWNYRRHNRDFTDDWWKIDWILLIGAIMGITLLLVLFGMIVAWLN